jgi:hypothetical protein
MTFLYLLCICAHMALDKMVSFMVFFLLGKFTQPFPITYHTESYFLYNTRSNSVTIPYSSTIHTCNLYVQKYV